MPPERRTNNLATHLSWCQAPAEVHDRILPKSVVQYRIDYLGGVDLTRRHFSYVQILRFHSNLAVNTLRLGYETQPFNAITGH